MALYSAKDESLQDSKPSWSDSFLITFSTAARYVVYAASFSILLSHECPGKDNKQHPAARVQIGILEILRSLEPPFN